MDNSQFAELRLILALLIFTVDLLILSLGLITPGTRGYVVDGLAGFVFLLLWVLGKITD